MRPTDLPNARHCGRVGDGRARSIGTASAMAAMLLLAACHSARQAPGMDPNDLSDDRGAHAGRFISPAENAAGTDDTNQTDPADNGTTVENSQ